MKKGLLILSVLMVSLLVVNVSAFINPDENEFYTEAELRAATIGNWIFWGYLVVAALALFIVYIISSRKGKGKSKRK